MREISMVLAVIFGSLGALLSFAAYRFDVSQWIAVLPWVFLSYLWGAMTLAAFTLYLTRPKPKPRRPLDDFAGQVVPVDLPTEHTTRH